MRSYLLCCTLPCIALSSGCGAETPDLIPTPVTAAKNVDVSSGFAFTLSPDDLWIVYFEMAPELATDPTFLLPGKNLRAIHTPTGQLYSFTLESGLMAENGAGVADSDSWTADSLVWQQLDISLIFNDRTNPQLLTEVALSGDTRQIGERVLPQGEISHCSDCYEGMFDTKIARQVGERADHIGHLSHGEAVVCPEQEFVYYSHKPHDKKLEVTQRIIETGKDRTLTTHTGPNVSASFLRLSPDGRFLAYQITTEPLFTRPPKLYIVEIETKERWYVGEQVFGTMHWTSDSRRLYFAQRDNHAANCDIRYIEPPREAELPDGD